MALGDCSLWSCWPKNRSSSLLMSSFWRISGLSQHLKLLARKTAPEASIRSGDKKATCSATPSVYMLYFWIFLAACLSWCPFVRSLCSEESLAATLFMYSCALEDATFTGGGHTLSLLIWSLKGFSLSSMLFSLKTFDSSF